MEFKKISFITSEYTFSFVISQIMIYVLSLKLGLMMADFIIEPQLDFTGNIYFYSILKMFIAAVSITGISSVLSKLNYLLHKATI
jgi:hypothetical protein